MLNAGSLSSDFSFSSEVFFYYLMQKSLFVLFLLFLSQLARLFTSVSVCQRSICYNLSHEQTDITVSQNLQVTKGLTLYNIYMNTALGTVKL